MTNLRREVVVFVDNDIVDNIARNSVRAQLNRNNSTQIVNLEVGEQRLDNDFIAFRDQLQDENTFSDNRNRFHALKVKIRFRTLLCFIRLVLLSFSYLFDGYYIGKIIKPLIKYLIIHESIIILNYFIYSLSNALERESGRQDLNSNSDLSNNSFLKNCVEKIDTINNVFYFIWFIYAAYCYETDVLLYATNSNKYIVSYLKLLVIIGFFMYIKIIFACLMLACCLPCLIFVIYIKVQNIKKEQLLISKLLENLEKEKENFENYKIKHNLDLDSCLICLENFKSDDLVIGLKCNVKHCFHNDCIFKWINQKPNCPICRTDLHSDANV